MDQPRSDGLTTQILYAALDYETVPVGEWLQVDVPIFPVAHPLRAGSRLRVQINTPGGDLPLWFENQPG